jgi:mono/diheme cytochrome c family protein
LIKKLKAKRVLTMKYLLTAGIVLACLAVGAIIFAWFGIYNIAATEPHWGITSSFIAMLRDRSIAVRSEDVQVPNLNDAKLREIGFPHYHEMCRLCHGAQGYKPAEFAEGLYPSPPSLTAGHIQEELSDAEIYWIVKYGLKMTGMPAFGPTHDEEELWGLVAIVKDLPRMSAEQYRHLVKSTNPEGETGHGHLHGTAKEEKGS